jgi:hypothetical protein
MCDTIDTPCLDTVLYSFVYCDMCDIAHTEDEACPGCQRGVYKPKPWAPEYVPGWDLYIKNGELVQPIPEQLGVLYDLVHINNYNVKGPISRYLVGPVPSPHTGLESLRVAYVGYNGSYESGGSVLGGAGARLSIVCDMPIVPAVGQSPLCKWASEANICTGVEINNYQPWGVDGTPLCSTHIRYGVECKCGCDVAYMSAAVTPHNDVLPYIPDFIPVAVVVYNTLLLNWNKNTHHAMSADVRSIVYTVFLCNARMRGSLAANGNACCLPDEMWFKILVSIVIEFKHVVRDYDYINWGPRRDTKTYFSNYEVLDGIKGKLPARGGVEWPVRYSGSRDFLLALLGYGTVDGSSDKLTLWTHPNTLNK